MEGVFYLSHGSRSTAIEINKVILIGSNQEYIIEEESVELPYIPVEYVFGESRTWNAIKPNRLK